MKKLLVLLLISVLAAFVFTSCTVPPSEGEGEGEGEEEYITIEVDGAVLINGVKYVAAGTHDVTVTFSTPIAGYAGLYLYDCVGDYSKAPLEKGSNYVLFPNADRTVWTGSAYFGCCYEDNFNGSDPCDPGCTDCCATLIEVEVGECDWCYYTEAVIVDSEPPEVDLGVRFVDCGDPCDPCDDTRAVSMEWTSMMEETNVCDDPEDCCGDDCSGIASWTMTVGGTICDEPCDIITGEDCPVEGVSACCLYYADPDEWESEDDNVCYNITFDIVDMVGNEIKTEEWVVCLDTDEVVSFNGNPVDWDEEDLETDWIGVSITGDCLGT